MSSIGSQLNGPSAATEQRVAGNGPDDGAGAGAANRGVARRALKQVPWQGIQSVGQGLLQLALLGFLARIVSPAEFGLVALANIAMGIGYLFSEVGIGHALIQRADLTDRHIHTGLTLSFMLGVAFFLATQLAAPWIAVALHEPRVELVLRVLAFAFVLAGPGVVAESLLQRELAFKPLMYIRLSSWAFGYAPVGVVLASLGYGVWALVFASLAQFGLQTALLLWRQPHRIRFGLARHEARELSLFGLALTAERVIHYLLKIIDRLLITRWLGAASLGSFQVASQIIEMPLRYASQTTAAILYPALSLVKKDRSVVPVAYLRSIGAGTMFFAPIGMVFSLLAEPIVKSVLGPDWTLAILPLAVLAPTMAVSNAVGVSDVVVRSIGRVYQSALRRGVALLLIAPLLWWGLTWGLPGISVASAVGACIVGVLSVDLAVRCSGTSWWAVLAAMLPGIRLAFFACAASSFALVLGAALDLPPWLVLGLGAALAAAACVIVVFGRPDLLDDGTLWLVGEADKLLPDHWLLGRLRVAASDRRDRAP